MRGRHSREKGARAERELFGILNEIRGHKTFERNVLQSRIGGCDDQHAHIFAIEVKRHEKLNLPAWIKQAKQQAAPGQLPVLAYRRSHEPWTILVIADPHSFIDIFDVLAGT